MIMFRSVLVSCALLSWVLTACSGPTPTATPAVARTADPAAVVQAFWDALNAEDLQSALDLVSADFKCRGSCYFGGKESLRNYLQGNLGTGLTHAISDLRVEGETVTYSWTQLRNGLLTEGGQGEESMQVKDGLIVLWENLHP